MPPEHVQSASSALAGLARGRHDEHVSSIMNRFPFSNGPVPQTRGQNKAPAVPPGQSAPAQGAYASGGPVGPTSAASPCPSSSSTLVLFDDSGPYAWLGELYGAAVAHLSSHFGSWVAEPVSRYASGEMAAYTGVVYVGSTYEQPLSVAFLDDVLKGTTPVVWMYDNIWQLANRAPDFVGKYGYNPWVFDTSAVAEVRYKGTSLSRYAANGAGIMSYSVVNPAKATVLAEAVRPDGTTFPWAIRSNNLTYIGEIPFAYIAEKDRYLAFSDLLFDALAPTTSESHRALVRIEDVNATTSPADLRKIADYLSSQGVPFSIAVIPMYVDPSGAYNNGVAQTIRLKDAPDVVQAIRYMISKGGTAIMHGYTHQYGQIANPYSGVSADDFEFYTAHIDALNYVVYDGPTAEDTGPDAARRIDLGLVELSAAGLPAPTIFEYPHYAGSAADSQSIAGRFSTVYHRGLYFGGALAGQPADYTHVLGQFFPYTVRDMYGWKVLPENIANYEPEAMNNNPPRLPADIIANAKANLVVRDGMASMYFHPYLALSALQEIVQGIKALGYTFVPAGSL